jgi:hypothetical protein
VSLVSERATLAKIMILPTGDKYRTVRPATGTRSSRPNSPFKIPSRCKAINSPGAISSEAISEVVVAGAAIQMATTTEGEEAISKMAEVLSIFYSPFDSPFNGPTHGL